MALADSAVIAAHASNLVERAKFAPLGVERSTESDPRAVPASRCARWIERLDATGVLAARYQSLGLDHAAFTKALRSPAAPLTNDAGLEFVAAFVDRVLDRAQNTRSGIPLGAVSSVGDGLPRVPWPIALEIADTLRASLTTTGFRASPHYCHQEVEQSLFRSIVAEVRLQLLPALVTELHVAREAGDLRGETSETRFADYVERRSSEAAALGGLFTHYPVLARRLANIAGTRCAAAVELIERFDRDYDAVLAASGPASRKATSPRLRDISGATGDTHRHGRAVRILTFEDDHRVVYKPRPVGADLAFAGLVDWLNSRGQSPGIRAVQPLDRGAYGWFPFVEPVDCTRPDQVGRFFERQGAHAAILYVLGGYDFLYENVKASGEWPLLIDLECIASPSIPAYNGQLFDSAARRLLDESVLRAGLLPNYAWGNANEAGVNVSPLTLIDGQLLPQDVIVWGGLGTDRVRQLTMRQEVRSDHSHLPSLGGDPQPINVHTAVFEQGFVRTYRFLCGARAALLSPNSPLERFAAAEIRVVLRNTRDYARLQTEALHPYYLASGVLTDELLDRLWSSSCVRYTPTVIQSEINQLWNDDVPLFHTTGASRGLSADGQLLSGEYFEEDAVSGMRRRLEQLSETDLDRQLSILRRAFAIVDAPRVAASHTAERPVVSHAATPHPPRDLAESLTAEAVALGDQLLDAAIDDGRSLAWIGLSMSSDAKWNQTSLDSSLYDGGDGIAFFLLYLHKRTALPRFKEALEKIVTANVVVASEKLLKNRRRLRDWVVAFPSAFTFPCSSAYLALHVDAALGTKYLDVVLPAMLAFVELGLTCRFRADFLTGAAGVMHLLVKLHIATADPACLRLARALSDLLERNAQQQSVGLGWPETPEAPCLGGFAHGGSGISWTLAELGVMTGDERLIDLGCQALRYDRTLFRPNDGVWWDARYPELPIAPVQWCHGASGISLARGLMYETLRTTDLLADVEAAVQIVGSSSRPDSDCLCHGTLGNALILRRLARNTARADFESLAHRLLYESWRDSRARETWRAGMPGRNVSLPGLFMGMAGIGLALLDFATDSPLPSVLALDGPNP